MAWERAGVEARAWDEPGGDARARDRLAAFRGELHGCLAARADELFELADGVLCSGGPVRVLAGLSLEPEHRRGHGALYDGLNAGRAEITRLRWSLAALPLPAWPDGRIRLAADVSNWLRPDAGTSPERMFCHCYGRAKGNAQMIPGWPYSVIAALEPGRTSWTAVLDAVRLGPGDDETEATARQVRGVVERLAATGHWRAGDADILIVFDAGYDVTRLAWLLKDLPVEVLGRLRSNRALYFPPPPRRPGRGRPSRHGAEFKLDGEKTWPVPAVTTVTETARYGTAAASAWGRLHPRLTSRAAWEHHDGELPVIEGTLIRLQVDHLAGDRHPKPAWLWSSAASLTPADVDLLWQAFLRRFDLEHTFRLFKQVLGWTAPKIRDPAAADRWTWIIIAAYTQLRLAASLAADLRLPWQRPQPPGAMTPARVRRGFRAVRETPGTPAALPRPSRPGPGRPKGSRNRHKAPRHDVGKRNLKRANRAKRKARNKTAKLNGKL